MKIQSIVLVSAIAILVGCDKEEQEGPIGYDLSFLDGQLESVRGFKFGSAPETNGTTDVVLKLDPPVRHFDKIHLGYHSNRLHTVTFCGGVAQDREPHIRTLQEEQRILKTAGFSSWMVKADRTDRFPGELDDRDPICYVSKMKDRQVVLSSPFFHPLDCYRDESLGGEKWMPTVTFMATDVKKDIGEISYADFPRGLCSQYKCKVYLPREIGGLGLPYKMYFRAVPDFENDDDCFISRMFYKLYEEEDRPKMMSLLASRLAQAKSIHCEDYDIIRNGDRIESVAGFKFGLAPTVRGTSDVILKLDKPLRNFTMVHLGYYSNRLHTVAFMGFTHKEMRIVALEKEQGILAKKGFCTWQKHNVIRRMPINSWKCLNPGPFTDRFTWVGTSNYIDIAFAKKQFYWHPELMTVVFMDRNVKRNLDDENNSSKKNPNRAHLLDGICYLREIRGLGRLAKYYFRDPSVEQHDDHFSISADSLSRNPSDSQSPPHRVHDFPSREFQ